MRLLFVHGICQGKRNPVELEAEWRKYLETGLAAVGRSLPEGVSIDFPFYGKELDNFVAQLNMPIADVATAKGVGGESEFAVFARELALEAQVAKSIPDREIREDMIRRHGEKAVEKGVENWEWVQSIISVLDNRAPALTEKTFSIFLRDVFLYTRRSRVRNVIDGIVAEKLTHEPTVVVGHSLGSVVAYNVIASAQDAAILSYITLGSPLGIRGINSSLTIPWKNVGGKKGWFNAFDRRDVVALNALDQSFFGVRPDIGNDSTLINVTDNHHGISSYLDKKVVAQKILEGFS